MKINISIHTKSTAEIELDGIAIMCKFSLYEISINFILLIGVADRQNEIPANFILHSQSECRIKFQMAILF
jgi:hypothetical protein